MSPCLIALDWGTTRARAYLVDSRGAILDRRDEPLGILNVSNGDFAGAFEQLAGAWLARTGELPVIAGGMIGSRQGWREAPYVTCPAGTTDLADRLIAVEAQAGRKIWLVPGVACIGEDGMPDVMRGEETQIVGCLQPGEQGRRVCLLPGTHSKWALVEDRRIVRFATFMTGELFGVLKAHSILGRLMQSGEHDAAAFRRGLDRAARKEHDLLRSLFGVRTLGLFDRMPATGLADYLSGILIGSEIVEAHRWLAAGGGDLADIAIIGDETLAGLYRDALSLFGLSARLGPRDAVVPGLLRIARQAGLLNPSPME